MTFNLPNGWTLAPMSDVVEVNPKRSLQKGLTVPFVEMAALPIGGSVVRHFGERKAGDGGAKFAAGDTLFARITPCTENGKLGFVEAVPNGGVALGSTEFIVLSGKEGVTIPRFVTLLASWDVVRGQAIGYMEGTSGRQRVPNWAFDVIEVPVPPCDEQQSIVELIGALDALIDAEQALVGETERRSSERLFRAKQVLLSDLLSGQRLLGKRT